MLSHIIALVLTQTITHSFSLVLFGYPPREIVSYDGKELLSVVGVVRGETVTLQELDVARHIGEEVMDLGGDADVCLGETEHNTLGRASIVAGQLTRQ